MEYNIGSKEFNITTGHYMSERIQVRIDEQLKKEVKAILHQIELTESEAIRMFYKPIQYHHGLPFEAKIPNKQTLQAFEESDHHASTLRNLVPKKISRNHYVI